MPGANRHALLQSKRTRMFPSSRVGVSRGVAAQQCACLDLNCNLQPATRASAMQVAACRLRVRAAGAGASARAYRASPRAFASSLDVRCNCSSIGEARAPPRSRLAPRARRSRPCAAALPIDVAGAATRDVLAAAAGAVGSLSLVRSIELLAMKGVMDKARAPTHAHPTTARRRASLGGCPRIPPRRRSL